MLLGVCSDAVGCSLVFVLSADQIFALQSCDVVMS